MSILTYWTVIFYALPSWIATTYLAFVMVFSLVLPIVALSILADRNRDS